MTDTRLMLSLPADQEVGVPADFVSVWHGPNGFVLDFIAVKQPPRPETDPAGNPTGQNLLEARVASRVRIPPEQVFPLIAALQTQANQWMQETGRVEPPDAWFPPPSTNSPDGGHPIPPAAE